MAFSLCFEELDVERLRREQEQAKKNGPEAAKAQEEKAVTTAVATIDANNEDDSSSSTDDSGSSDSSTDSGGSSSGSDFGGGGDSFGGDFGGSSSGDSGGGSNSGNTDPGASTDDADPDEEPATDPDADEDPEADPDPDADPDADPDDTKEAKPDDDADKDAKKKDDDKEAEEKEKKDKEDEELKKSEESFRRFGSPSVALEDYLDHEAGAEILGMVSSAATNGYQAAKWVVTGLAELGVEYGPGILKGLGKGLLFTVAKLAQGLATMYEAFSESMAKRKATVENLEKQLNDLKQALSAARERNKGGAIDKNGRFEKTSVIDHFKIGIKADPTITLSVLNKFLDTTVLKIAQGAVDDLVGLRRLADMAGKPSDVDIMRGLQVTMSRSGFHQANISGVAKESHAVEELVYSDPLPGDVLFHAVLPVSNLGNIEEIEKAYDQSTIELHFDKENYHTVETVPVVTLASVEKMVSQLEETITILKHQTTLFEKIEASKPSVMGMLKAYVSKMVKVASPVDLDKSMAEPMYMKAKFVSSVYLRGLVQMQIYVARVFGAVCSYANYCLSHY